MRKYRHRKMTHKTIQVDPAFLIRLAKDHTALKKRVAHLEDHIHDDTLNLPVAPGLFVRATFQTLVPQLKQKAYMQQFQAELLSVLKQWGVSSLEAYYNQ
jgi:hypothetical protein